MAVIGHGWRRRPAHDGVHDWILVRRGRCKVCEGTLTVLPAWCVPGAPYSLLARQQAVEQLVQGEERGQATQSPICTPRFWGLRSLSPLSPAFPLSPLSPENRNHLGQREQFVRRSIVQPAITYYKL